MKDFIELRRILAIIVAHVWLLLFVTALAALAGALISRSQAPVYQATTTVLVGQFMQATSVNRTDMQTSTDVAKTYADIALRQPVLSAVVETLKLDRTWQALKKQVQVKAIEGTQLIEVTAEADSPASARSIADTVASQLIAISPTTLGNTETDTYNSFVQQQLGNLKQRLTDAQTRLKDIEAAIAVSTSPTVLAQLRGERATLEQSITEWLKNYADLSEAARKEGAANNYLTIIEPAQGTKDPVRPRTALDTVIAGVVGLVFALALAFLRDYLDSGIHSSEQLKEVLGLAPLAEIGAVRRSGLSLRRNTRKGRPPRWRAAGNRGPLSEMAGRTLVTLEQPRSPQSESFRALRTNIQFASPDRPLQSLVVTSAVPMEGKSFVAANLAIVLAQLGRSVVLVDADLRRPSVHAIFGLPNRSGFTNLVLPESLAGIVLKSGLTSLVLSESLAGIGQRIPEVPNLTVITSGPLPANPSELLHSEQVTRAMSYLAEHADFVIYDSPPISVVTDPAILGARVDGVLLVARAGATRSNIILSAKQTLEQVGVHFVLPVLNAAEPRDMNTYQGYYRHYGRRRAEPDDVSAPLTAEDLLLARVQDPASGARGGESNDHGNDRSTNV